MTRGENFSIEDLLFATLMYLDEDYEKNQPCEHRDSYQVDGRDGEVYYNVCNSCGVLFFKVVPFTV